MEVQNLHDGFEVTRANCTKIYTMPLIEVSPDNLSRLDAICSVSGLTRDDALKQALEIAQYAHLDEVTRSAILNAPIFNWNDALEDSVLKEEIAVI